MKFLTLTLLTLSLSSLKPLEGAIAQEPIQSTNFVQTPSLVSLETNDRDPNDRNALYSLQISVPQQAGSSLQKLAIAQKDPIEPISFSPDRTTAYIQEASGERIPVQTTTAIDPNTKTVSVTFVSPVAAGKTVIVGLRPQSNPSLEGEYVFGVTVFTTSQQASGQFIGYGRLGIYNTGFYNAAFSDPR